MIDIKHISSSDNPRYKSWQKLLQRKYRDREGLFLIEGELLIKDAISSGGMICDLIVSSEEETPSETIMSILDELKDDHGENRPKVFMLSGELFRGLSQTENGRLVVGVFKKPTGEKLSGNVLILDRIQDPGNMGTLIRTSDAAGFGGVITVKGSVDPFSPKVVRAAAGSLMRVPVVSAEDGEDIKRILKLSQENNPHKGFSLITTSLKGEKTFWDLDMKDSYGRIAVIIGNEGSGVSDELVEISDEIVKIPMAGGTESLNAGISGALIMYEVMRQQRNS